MRRLPRPRLPRPNWSRLRWPGRPRLRRPGWPHLRRPHWLRRRRPSWPLLRPSRFASITERLKDAGYAVEDAAFEAGRVAKRVPAAIGRGSREFWLDLEIDTRLRLALALGAVAAFALVWLVAVPALPCQAPGGDRCPPADDAIHLVPQDALAYVHLNVDRDTEQYEDAAKVSERVPGITKQVIALLLSRLPGPDGAAPDFERDIEPWFGGEAALAIVPAGGGAVGEQVQLLEASDESEAREFADSIAAGKPRSTTYREVEVRVDRRGLATALVGGFLAIGTRSGVREAIDADSGAEGTGSLAGDPNAERSTRRPPRQALRGRLSLRRRHRGARRRPARVAGHLRLGDQPGRQPGSGGGAGGGRRGARHRPQLPARSASRQGPPWLLLRLPFLRAPARRRVAPGVARLRGHRPAWDDSQVAARAGERHRAGAGGGGRRPGQAGEEAGQGRSPEGPPALAGRRSGHRAAAGAG